MNLTPGGVSLLFERLFPSVFHAYPLFPVIKVRGGIARAPFPPCTIINIRKNKRQNKPSVGNISVFFDGNAGFSRKNAFPMDKNVFFADENGGFGYNVELSAGKNGHFRQKNDIHGHNFAFNPVAFTANSLQYAKKSPNCNPAGTISAPAVKIFNPAVTDFKAIRGDYALKSYC